MIIPYLTLWERTAGRASSKAPDWQPATVHMRAAGRTVRVRAYLPPVAVEEDMGAVRTLAMRIMGVLVAEDVKRLAQDDTMTTQDDRTWHVDNPMYAGGGLVRCMLREGRSAHPVRVNPEL